MLSILLQEKLHGQSNGISVFTVGALPGRKHRFTPDISGIPLLTTNRSGCQKCPASNDFFFKLLDDSHKLFLVLVTVTHSMTIIGSPVKLQFSANLDFSQQAQVRF
jgi:hypothetical protein